MSTSNSSGRGRRTPVEPTPMPRLWRRLKASRTPIPSKTTGRQSELDHRIGVLEERLKSWQTRGGAPQASDRRVERTEAALLQLIEDCLEEAGESGDLSRVEQAGALCRRFWELGSTG